MARVTSVPTDYKMTRCECHGIEFTRVLGFAARNGITTLEILCERVGFGQTCTACRCDASDFLSQNLSTCDVECARLCPLREAIDRSVA